LNLTHSQPTNLYWGFQGPGLKTPSDMYFDPAAFIFSPIIGA